MTRRRLIVNTLTVGSVLVSAAVLVVFVRSLTDADQLGYSKPANINERYARVEWTVLSAQGFLSFGRAEIIPNDDASAEWLRGLDQRSKLGWYFGTVGGYNFSWQFLRIGFFSDSDKNGRTTRHWKSIEVPDWLLLIVVSIPAQVALVRVIRARRAKSK